MKQLGRPSGACKLRSVWMLLPLSALVALLLTLSPAQSQTALSLEDGFRTPPKEARPWVYYLLMNGYVNRQYVETELRDYVEKGIGGLCIFDMGARGDKAGFPPAGPAFLSPQSAEDLAHVIHTAGSLGLEADLSVTSSWDMGADWVKPEDASMTLVETELDVRGPGHIREEIPLPALPPETPRGADGRPLFARNVATIAIPNPQRLAGHSFLFQVEKPWPQQVERVVLFNTKSGETEDAFAKDFLVEASETSVAPEAFREVFRGSLAAREGAQDFRVPPTAARYLRLTILSGHNPRVEYVQLAEFEAHAANGRNVVLSHRVNREIDGAELIQAPSSRGQLGAWAAANLHDGVKSGPRGSWSSAGAPPLRITDASKVQDISSRIDEEGNLDWEAPAGAWKVIRYVVTNTGERLKVPSPNSEGLATDHFNAEATLRYIRELTRRLRPALGDLSKSALRELYLASYEVRGRVWTPAFLSEFQKRRGYSLAPFLPALSGAMVGDQHATERVLFDFRKTQGELLVDAYYRAAASAAHESGLGIESEAGGPGPPIHNVPVDALLANSAVDSVRGEFWPYRPQADGLWVVKETASAAHIYGKPLVAMEAFTSVHHWEEGPQDLKDSADRAFCEGMNHVVWHTAAHLPPEAGKPGWVYGAGTHLNPNVPWWPMARPFLDYLARASYMLRQGRFVADVLYYYGDGGYRFVPPKHIDPELGFGYDYDVTNSQILLEHARVEDSDVVLSSGMHYKVLVLPDEDAMSLPVLQRIAQLVKDGATVIGRKPSRTHGYFEHQRQDAELHKLAAQLWGDLDGNTKRVHAYGKGSVVWGVPVREILRERGRIPDLSILGGAREDEVDFIHRSATKAEIYFVRNKAKKGLQFEASFRVGGRIPELWNPVSGKTRDVPVYTALGDRTNLHLDLPPLGSLFVVFRKRDGNVVGLSTDTRQPNSRQMDPGSREAESLPVGGPWRVRLVDGPGAPASVSMESLRSLTDYEDPGVRYFSGIAEYETEVDVPATWVGHPDPVQLDLGELWAIAEVFVNDRPFGVVWMRPFSIDVVSALRKGQNTIRVRVANNWINRLVGDARATDGTRHTRTNVATNTPQAIPWNLVEPRQSGLLGPVKLERSLRR